MEYKFIENYDGIEIWNLDSTADSEMFEVFLPDSDEYTISDAIAALVDESIAFSELKGCVFNHVLYSFDTDETIKLIESDDETDIIKMKFIGAGVNARKAFLDLIKLNHIAGSEDVSIADVNAELKHFTFLRAELAMGRDSEGYLEYCWNVIDANGNVDPTESEDNKIELNRIINEGNDVVVKRGYMLFGWYLHG